MLTIGHSVHRKEAADKVTGTAKYANDMVSLGVLHAALVTSPYAHARIRSVRSDRALKMAGVRAVVSGDGNALLCGEVMEDRPPLGRDVVRYHGEPVAVVVADSAAEASAAARAVDVEYEPLPVVNSVTDALKDGATLVHPGLDKYKVSQGPCVPEAGSNVADRAKVRKGDMDRGWAEAEVVIEGHFVVPPMDHAAMETRSAQVQLWPDGRVFVSSATQAPFEVQRTIAKSFKRKQGQVIVQAPLVGGAFGGKAPVQLEVIAFLASEAVRGRAVRLTNTREQDIGSSPVGAGLDATIKLGAKKTGELVAAEMTYRVDAGAYTDSIPRIGRAIASACTGPYRVENVWCDVLSVYTNHVYTSALRGFGYMPMTFAIERAMDKLAEALNMDPLKLRRTNAITPGQTTPTRYKLTRSIIGDLPQCLEEAGRRIGWQEGRRVPLDERTVRGRGIAAVWKTSSSPQNAISAAIVHFNQDGTANLSVGAVECGPGTKTTVAQILAERMGMDLDDVHVHMDVSTLVDPEHWKTVASMATFMVGRAVIDAADDALRQMKEMTGIVLRCPPEDLDVGRGRVYLRDDPSTYLEFKDIAHGYKYPDGDSIGGQIIGRGTFMVRHLTPLDKETGEGMAGPSWTVGAQAVEIELDRREMTYRIVRAVSVFDVGRVINPDGARGAVMGGMCQGLGFGSRECLLYDDAGTVMNNQLRTYKVMRSGEEPEYDVAFLETPQIDGPYGARAIGEHGILGMPAALANALCAATGLEVDDLPATPEALWRRQRQREAKRS